ncbi:acyltransferase domain-containing protein [Burkholderia ubonensis]|uniref:Malonyl-CoA:ACP transacylase (MAT) domain-containing protein n=1 Tax=Burkholderia ubonensis TaxID=101571 RepID=A0A1R1J4T4_9BURK|nr:acyltransferase domain-containing protein [Burkholderia ubonensis]OMG70367.1 hypothetical protein BW685_25695 [Burkholderia ubonensis]
MELPREHDGLPSVYVIPGQGDTPAGALRNLYGLSRLSRAYIDETLDHIEAALRDYQFAFDPCLIRNVLLEEKSTDSIPVGIPQLASFATAICVHRIMEWQQIRPVAIIGQSLGEIAALVCAGVWRIPDGVRAVLALNAAFRPLEGHGGMVMVSASEADTLHLLDQVGRDDLVLACVNGPRQTVVSGPNAALDALLTTPHGRDGIKLHRLPIPYPAHHPALHAAADQFMADIATLPRDTFRIPVYSAVARRRYADDDDLARGLADCFIKPYHMPATLDRLRSDLAHRYIDLGMSGGMSRCIKAILPDAHVYAPTRTTSPAHLVQPTQSERLP